MIVFLILCSYNVLKAWMQKDNDMPLRAEKHLIAGAIAGRIDQKMLMSAFTIFLSNFLIASLVFGHLPNFVPVMQYIMTILIILWNYQLFS